MIQGKSFFDSWFVRPNVELWNFFLNYIWRTTWELLLYDHTSSPASILNKKPIVYWCRTYDKFSWHRCTCDPRTYVLRPKIWRYRTSLKNPGTGAETHKWNFCYRSLVVSVTFFVSARSKVPYVLIRSKTYVLGGVYCTLFGSLSVQKILP